MLLFSFIIEVERRPIHNLHTYNMWLFYEAYHSIVACKHDRHLLDYHMNVRFIVLIAMLQLWAITLCGWFGSILSYCCRLLGLLPRYSTWCLVAKWELYIGACCFLFALISFLILILLRLLLTIILFVSMYFALLPKIHVMIVVVTS